MNQTEKTRVSTRFQIPRWTAEELARLKEVGRQRKIEEDAKQEFHLIDRLATAVYGQCETSLVGTVGSCVNETLDDPKMIELVCAYIRVYGWWVEYDAESSSFRLDLDKSMDVTAVLPGPGHPIWAFKCWLGSVSSRPAGSAGVRALPSHE
jgi:hypothetical protein